MTWVDLSSVSEAVWPTPRAWAGFLSYAGKIYVHAGLQMDLGTIPATYITLPAMNISELKN